MNRTSGLLVLLTVTSLLAGCPPGDKKTAAKEPKKDGTEEPHSDDADEEARKKKPKPVPADADVIIRGLEAEVAALRRRIDTGSSFTYPGSINAHEHLYKISDLQKYLPAARQAGIGATVVVASPNFTLDGKGDKGEPGMSKNFTESLMVAAKAHPGEIIPFCSLDPKDPDKLKRLKDHVAEGAMGLKVYSGHSNFYADQGPVDDPGMDEVWSYLEETQLPINWHINLAKFMGEFERVMDKHPKLNVMIPHFGVVFWKPNGPAFEQFAALLRKHKNIYTDTSLGTREILIDGMAAIEPAIPKFRRFIEEFQNQIIWGTDSVITGNPEKTPLWYTKVIHATRDHLEKEVFTTELAAAYSKYYEKGREGDGRYQGLALPPAVLQKILIENAARWLHIPKPAIPAVAVAAPTPTATPTAPVVAPVPVKP